ncbi:MAG TPA: hypothetical protein VFR70_04855 [Flavobacterium sp.]|nr:hypothetical protein [Flavobacterium sp.]
MDIQLEKLELIKKLAATDDIAVIKSIKKIFKQEKKDWQEELTDEQKAAIEEGIADIEAGRVASYKSVMEKYKYATKG